MIVDTSKSERINVQVITLNLFTIVDLRAQTFYWFHSNFISNHFIEHWINEVRSAVLPSQGIFYALRFKNLGRTLTYCTRCSRSKQSGLERDTVNEKLKVSVVLLHF